MVPLGNSIRQLALDFTSEKLFGAPSKSGLGGKVGHVKHVIELVKEFQTTSDINRELLIICAQLHDIGRAKQWEVAHNFSDGLINHRYVAIQMIDSYIRENNIFITPDWRVLVDVMQYHGLPHLYGLAHESSIPYLEIISIVDDIENGCCGALGYLEDEMMRDDKEYIKNNPNADQGYCDPALVLDYMANGIKFDKAKMCHTYGEYFVFAATLAMNNLLSEDPKRRAIAKKAMLMPCYEFIKEDGTVVMLNALEGYCKIFKKYLSRETLSTYAIDALRWAFYRAE